MINRIDNSQLDPSLKRALNALLLVIGASLSLISAPLYALGSCSDYRGQAVLNELYHSNQSLNPGQYFVEAKALNYNLVTDGTYSGWSVTLCSQQAINDGAIKCISGNSALADANPANTSYVAGLSLSEASWPSGINAWIVVDQADWSNGHGYIDLHAGTGHGMEALLLDANGDLIDYLSVGGYTHHIGSSFASGCSLTQTTFAGSNTFNIQRVPDGTGAWSDSSGNAGDETTSTTNDVLPDLPAGTSYPEVSVTDTNVVAGDDALISVGFGDADGDGLADTFTQTVTIIYETQDGTAVSANGDYNAITTRTLTIPAGMSSVSVTVNTSPSATGGSYFNLYLQEVVPSAENGGALNATIADHFGKATFIPPPIAYYALDEGSWSGVANEVVDGSGNELHGVASNGLSTTPAKVCNGANLSDISQQITIADSSSLDFSGAHTLSLWIKPDTLPASGEGPILSKGDNYQLSLNSSGQIVWRWRDTAGIHTLNSTTAVLPGSWSHIAIVYSKLNNNDDAQAIYINSMVDNSTTTAANTLATNSDSLQIGGGLVGLIDELRIYNEALTQAIIKGDMNATHPCTLGSITVIAPSTATSCAEIPVSIAILDRIGVPITDYSGEISLSSSTGVGAWSVNPAIGTNPDSPAGTFTTAALDDGRATYNFVPADNGTVTLYFRHGLATSGLLLYAANIPEGVTGTSNAIEVTDATQYFAITEDPITIAGRPQTITIQAMDSSCGVDNNYQNRTISLNPSDPAYNFYMWIDRNGVLTGAANPTAGDDLNLSPATPIACSINLTPDPSCALHNIGTSLNTTTATATTITFDANSTAIFELNTIDVGQYQLHVNHTLCTAYKGNGSCRSATNLKGVSNTITTTPFAFDLDVVDADNVADDRANSGTTGSSYAADATGSAYKAAGAAFDLTLTALQWDAADDLDNDGVPDDYASLADNSNVTSSIGQEGTTTDIQFSHSLIAPSGGNPGTLNPTTISVGSSCSSPCFSSGAATATLNWSEVGIIDIEATLPNYLGSGKSIYGKITNVGRFYPDHFTLSLPALTNRIDGGYSASSFTYMGEDLSLAYSVSALNAANVATTNYRGVFAKWDGTGASAYGVTSTYTVGALSGSTNLSSRLVITSSTLTTAWKDGSADAEIKLNLTQPVSPNDPDGPYITDFGVNFSDSDGVALTGLDLDVDSTTPNDHQLIGVTSLRRGRALLSDGYASASASIAALPLTIEYFDGSSFIYNSDDIATAFDPSLLICSEPDPANCLAVTNPVPVANGGSFTFTPDGISRVINYRLNLSSFIYLRDEWDSTTPGDDDPVATLTLDDYNSYHNDKRFFYWNEGY